MDAEHKPLEERAPVPGSEAAFAGPTIKDKIAQIAFQALLQSQIYKEPRMARISLFEKTYNNDIPPRFRQLHNIVVPVFAGLVDEMQSSFNDEIQLKFKENKPSDYLTLPKVQAMWEVERDSPKPNAKWNYKARTDRFNAILSGRGILQNYAESNPEYRNVLETINYTDFHCDPLGGGLLENHLFAGREGIFRTIEEIYADDRYSIEQRKKIKDFSWSSEFWRNIETTYGTKLERFRSLGLDPESNSAGYDRTVNLCRFIVTFEGARYAVILDPLTQTWLEVEPWDKDYPWYTWATHEDHKNFWSKSFADDFYTVSDGVYTFINQEATNREKMNNQSRAFDPTMFPDAQRLDSAQYETGKLVPFNSTNPADATQVRKAEDGIYTFETPELKGSIELSQLLLTMVEKYTGAGDLAALDDIPKGTKPAVVMAMKQKIAKRVGLRSASFKECYAALGMSYFEGLKENMPVSVSVSVLGEDGFISEAELRRDELSKLKNVSCSVASTSEQEASDNVKTQGRIEAINLITGNPNLSSFEKEIILRDIGKFDENQIAFALQNIPYTARKQIAHASRVIQDILRGKEPDVYFGADISYQKYIYNWLIDHKSDMKKKPEVFRKFMEFLKAIAPIVQQNMQMAGKRQANQIQQQRAMQPQAKGAAKPAAKSSSVSTSRVAQKSAQRTGLSAIGA